MNKEIYEKLKKYQVHLRRGYKGNYIYGLLQKDFDEMYVLYRELGGNAQLKYTCNSCNLQLLKFLGKLYFEYEENLVVSDDETKEKKKTRGRKKKENK